MIPLFYSLVVTTILPTHFQEVKSLFDYTPNRPIAQNLFMFQCMVGTCPYISIFVTGNCAAGGILGPSGRNDFPLAAFGTDWSGNWRRVCLPVFQGILLPGEITWTQILPYPMCMYDRKYNRKFVGTQSLGKKCEAWTISASFSILPSVPGTTSCFSYWSSSAASNSQYKLSLVSSQCRYVIAQRSH